MTLSGESASSPIVNPFDKWSSSENAVRQATVVERMARENPRLMEIIGSWANLLVNGEPAPCEERPEVRSVESDTPYPGHFTYETPPNLKGGRGFVEYNPADLESPNPPIHMALDAAVKACDSNSFVAGAQLKDFDPYFSSEGSTVECYVLGRLENVAQDPSATADKALVIHLVRGRPVVIELAPRYSAEGHAAREAVKAAREEAQRRLFEARESARRRGELVGRHLARVLAVGLADDIDDNRRPSDEVGRALQHVRVPGQNPGQRTTAREVAQLRESAGSVDTRDILNALASLYPNDTTERLLARVAGMIASATQHE